MADDLQISDAHRNALDAGREMFGPDKRFTLPRPNMVKSDVGGCSVYLDAADACYAAAADAAFSGSEAQWIAAMNEAALWNHAYNTCLMSTLYTTEEVFG